MKYIEYVIRHKQDESLPDQYDVWYKGRKVGECWLSETLEIDLMNRGAEGLAKQLLHDDGRGEMSPGPCAEILHKLRELERAKKNT